MSNEIKIANNVDKDLAFEIRSSLFLLSDNIKSLHDTLSIVDKLEYELTKKSLIKIKNELNKLQVSQQEIIKYLENKIKEQIE
jgi:hypothetical protein